jgi:uncharacterized protein
LISLVIIPGLLLGLTSSLHCIGMCGPLSLGIPFGNAGGWKRSVNLVLYQLGRVVTYIMLGLIAGLFGRGILLAGYQQALSVTAGMLILLVAAGFYARGRIGQWPFARGFYKTVSRLLFRLINGASTPYGALLFGMANGLLPCGMVYIAALTSLASGDLYYSALFMLFFGLGTMPAMLLVVMAGQRLSARFRFRWMNRLTPVIIAAAGLLLIIRGLNLNLPFLSPYLNGVARTAVSCFH